MHIHGKKRERISMQRHKHDASCFILVLGWSGRILAGLLAAGLVIFVGGNAVRDKGLPNPFTEPLPIALEIAGLAAAWVGLIVAWKREAAGGILILAGTFLFHLIEGKWMLPWAFLVLEFDGVLLLFYGIVQRKRRRTCVTERREAVEDSDA